MCLSLQNNVKQASEFLKFVYWFLLFKIILKDY